MRGKRKNKHTRLKKQEKQTIRTRLLEISMKVEDCIYHKKTISEVEAEIFMREVTSYKVGCSTDERSMQVIEKLVRCMKAIILEHQETRSKGSSNDDHPYFFNENHGAQSPSYSLPEEDRMQLTQEQELISVDTSWIHNMPGNKNNKTLYSENIEDDFAAKTNEITDVINLCDDDQVFIEPNATNYTSNINPDSNIHKALSNLSINALNNDNEIDDVGCSQSVLHNFQANSQFEQNTSNLLTVDSLRQVDTNKNKTTNVVYNIHDRVNQLNNKKNVLPVSNGAKEPINSTIFSNKQCLPDILHNFKEIDKFQQTEPQNTPVFNKMNTTNNIVTINPIQNLERKIPNENIVKPTITQWNVKDTRAININNNQNDPLVAKVSKAINTTYIFGKPPNATQTAAFPNNNCKDNAIAIDSVNNTPQNLTPVACNRHQDNINFTIKEYNSYKAQNVFTKTVSTRKYISKRGNKSIENDTATVKKKRAPRRKKNEETVKEMTNTIDLTGPHHKNQKKTKTGAIRTNPKKKRINKNYFLNEAPIPIYNRNVENDLSWLENIRFVREIDDDECDGALTNLSHKFWDNYDLPPIFDDSDFLCY